jgi:predicted Fe-Mo cluster-binding NifX family protein
LKIAAISDDGINISRHFGRASLYVVLTVEDGKIVSREIRSKAGHHIFVASDTEHTLAPGERHGYDLGAQAKHQRMAETITDCKVLLTGGMGWGAYESMKSYDIEPIVTDIANIEQAVETYLKGRLTNLIERLH